MVSSLGRPTATRMEDRALTSGEIEIARSVFGDTIDYTKVRLFKRKWWPFHPRNSAMAPMGNIYFHPEGGAWSEDFAKESLSRQGFFIHEMTHVWQTHTKGRSCGGLCASLRAIANKNGGRFQ